MQIKTILNRVQKFKSFVYRKSLPAPKLGGFLAQLEQWLDVESRLPRCQRRTAKRLFGGLLAEGYRGSCGPVQRFVKDWKVRRASGPAVSQAFPTK